MESSKSKLIFAHLYRPGRKRYFELKRLVLPLLHLCIHSLQDLVDFEGHVWWLLIAWKIYSEVSDLTKIFLLVPRTFRLYEELEKGEKAQLSDQSVSYGLDKGDDQSFTAWNGTIVGPPNTNFDGRIYFLNINCGPNYPAVAPAVRFTTKINIPSVNQQNGTVEPSKFPLFKSWSSEYTMEKILIAIKNEMIANRKNNQPADGDMYWVT